MATYHDVPVWQRGSLQAADVEALRQGLRGPWEFDIQQMGPQPGNESWRCHFVTDGGGIIYEDCYRVPVMLRGAPREGLFAFGFADERARSSGRWLGGEFPEATMGYARAGRNLDILMPGGGRTLVAFVPLAEFETCFERLSGLPASRAFCRDGVFVPLTVEARQEMIRRLREIIRGGSGDLGERVSLLIARAWLHGRQPAAAYGPAAWLNFRRAVERIAGSDPAPTLGQLALAMGLTLRTLETAFLHCTGMSPCRYLRQVRLDRVHKRLAEVSPEESTVTDVATREGFTELGRFSGEYRHAFGELPSETLRRASIRQTGRIPFNGRGAGFPR